MATTTPLDASSLPEEKSAVKWFRLIAIIFEVLLWGIGAIALLFKVSSWEGSNEMFTLAYALLALFYLLFTFLVSYARGKNQILTAVAAGVLLFLSLNGALFVMNGWKAGKAMLIPGLILTGIAFFATVYFMVNASEPRQYIKFYRSLSLRLALVFLFALVY
jgi:hypothetical protein